MSQLVPPSIWFSRLKTNPNNANTIWPTPVRRTVRRHRGGVTFFYMENTVQVPSGLPGLKAHGVHWATDVSILEMRGKRRQRNTSGLSSLLNLGQTLFEAQQIIFSGALQHADSVWHLKFLQVSFRHQLIQGGDILLRIQMRMVSELFRFKHGGLINSVDCLTFEVTALYVLNHQTDQIRII